MDWKLEKKGGEWWLSHCESHQYYRTTSEDYPRWSKFLRGGLVAGATLREFTCQAPPKEALSLLTPEWVKEVLSGEHPGRIEYEIRRIENK